MFLFLKNSLFYLFLIFLIACQPAEEKKEISPKPENTPKKVEAPFSGPLLTIKNSKGKHRVKLEIADTPEKRAQGLMKREELADDAGMLFIWKKALLTSFWMKDTPLSLDILFIDENKKINFISKATTPYSHDLITPDKPFLYVLEVKAGFVERNGITVGDQVVLSLP